jgi:Sec-independent protein translocase protein TatA
MTQTEGTTQNDRDTIKEFKDAVNMTAKELESWLKTDESQQVGQKDDEDESTGHKSGRRIIQLIQTKKSEHKS